MGYDKLIEELGKEVEEKVEAARRRAEDELTQLKQDCANELEQMRQERESGRSREVQEKTRVILAQARQTVLTTRITANRDLTDRLHHAALELLPGLCGDGYSDLFAKLADELPDFPWETVRVNPRDDELARHHFPDARIVADDSICGGMEVSGEKEAICVVNTLEKRLERLWPDLLPDMVAAAYKEIDQDAFAAKR